MDSFIIPWLSWKVFSSSPLLLRQISTRPEGKKERKEEKDCSFLFFSCPPARHFPIVFAFFLPHTRYEIHLNYFSQYCSTVHPIVAILSLQFATILLRHSLAYFWYSIVFHFRYNWSALASFVFGEFRTGTKIGEGRKSGRLELSTVSPREGNECENMRFVNSLVYNVYEYNLRVHRIPKGGNSIIGKEFAHF